MNYNADLLSQYKGEGQSNIGCLKEEISNMLDELNEVKPLLVDREFCNEVLSHVKAIRIAIMGIS